VDPWDLGLVAVIVVGLAAIVFGALFDRRKNARAAREMLSAPKRDIPHFHPASATPQYLSELQARRPPAEARAAVTTDQRRLLEAEIQAATTVTVPVGYASRDFVTDPAASWAIQHRPVVVLCNDAVGSIRELLPILEKVTLSATPLVLVAPEIAADVLATLEVNQLQGLTSVLAVIVSDDSHRHAIAQCTGATPLTRSDRQAGYFPASSLGRIGTWLSDSKASHLLAAGDRSPAPGGPTGQRSDTD
jgi:hypothetical protein